MNANSPASEEQTAGVVGAGGGDGHGGSGLPLTVGVFVMSNVMSSSWRPLKSTDGWARIWYRQSAG
jgi:hypothetical protein